MNPYSSLEVVEMADEARSTHKRAHLLPNEDHMGVHSHMDLNATYMHRHGPKPGESHEALSKVEKQGHRHRNECLYYGSTAHLFDDCHLSTLMGHGHGSLDLRPNRDA